LRGSSGARLPRHASEFRYLSASPFLRAGFIKHAWFYNGHAVNPEAELMLEKLAKKHHYKLEINHLRTLKDNEFRAALFSQEVRSRQGGPTAAGIR
jgi:hypothetical protein